jgi:hypothetical protein
VKLIERMNCRGMNCRFAARHRHTFKLAVG